MATALVTLARLGVTTRVAGRIGDDDFGRRIRRGLEGEGVDCRWLATDQGGTSQFAFIAVDAAARRTIFWNRGSARPLAAFELPADLLVDACLLHLDGLQREAALAAAHRARAAGIPTVLDGGTWRDGTAELLPFIDHLVVSERFARHLAPVGPPQAALPTLLGWGARAATVTCGALGSWSAAPDQPAFHQPAFPVAAVDTTGCGDVFHGGYLFGLLQGWGLPEIVRFAAACAALKARALGGRSAIPGRAEVEALLGSSTRGG